MESVINCRSTLHCSVFSLLVTRPNRPWGPSSPLYRRYRGAFLGVKMAGRDVEHPLPSSAEVKEKVELYLYSPFDLIG